jgi:hypothetical protein
MASHLRVVRRTALHVCLHSTQKLGAATKPKQAAGARVEGGELRGGCQAFKAAATPTVAAKPTSLRPLAPSLPVDVYVWCVHACFAAI